MKKGSKNLENICAALDKIGYVFAVFVVIGCLGLAGQGVRDMFVEGEEALPEYMRGK